MTEDPLDLFVFLIQWSAIILSALAGLTAARNHGMDFYGCLVIAFVSSVGGGTIRDMLLGRYPIFWIAEPVYVITVLVIMLLSISIESGAKTDTSIAFRIAQPVQKIVDEQSKVFITIDSLALGLWAYLGTIYALDMRTSLVVAPVMGVITASFGGVLRDVFLVRVPQLFMPGVIYVSAAAVGATVYALMWWLGFSDRAGFLACFMFTFLLRMISIKFNIKTFDLKGNN